MAAVGLKICGVVDPADAALCRAHGVTALGLNFWPGSRRCITVEQGCAVADAIADTVAEEAAAPRLVGVFVDEAPATVASVAARVGLDAIQPHGDADPAQYAALGLPWIWVVRTRIDPNDLVVPDPAPEWVLVDAPTPHYGGQGVRADWGWARDVVRALAPLPVWLAGGLRPDNAAQAIAAVGPAGLDIASGAERTGAGAPRKDPLAVAALASICAAHEIGYNGTQ